MNDLRPWPRPSGDPYHPGPPCPQQIKFPHVKQVFLVERHFYDLHWKPLSCQAVLGITSLPAHRADPQQLAALVRGEWAIENRDHYVRDVTLGEDRCRVRTGALPSIPAVMRSHTIGALRLLGFTNIAEGTRWARDDFQRRSSSSVSRNENAVSPERVGAQAATHRVIREPPREPSRPGPHRDSMS